MNFDPHAEQLLFRPDSFFLKPWRGWGVGRDRRGSIVARYEARGNARAGSRSAHVEHVFTFEDGRVQVSEWEISSDADERYVATDPRTGLQAIGGPRERDFFWAMRAPFKTPFGEQKVTTKVLFTRVAEAAAFSFATAHWLGLTLATYTTFYEHLDQTVT